MNTIKFSEKAIINFNRFIENGDDFRVTIYVMLCDHPFNKELRKGDEFWVAERLPFVGWFSADWSEAMYSYTVKPKPLNMGSKTTAIGEYRGCVIHRTGDICSGGKTKALFTFVNGHGTKRFRYLAVSEISYYEALDKCRKYIDSIKDF